LEERKKTDLKVVVYIIDEFCPIGKKLSKEEKQEIKSMIIKDEYLGHWNYRFLPVL